MTPPAEFEKGQGQKRNKARIDGFYGDDREEVHTLNWLIKIILFWGPNILSTAKVLDKPVIILRGNIGWNANYLQRESRVGGADLMYSSMAGRLNKALRRRRPVAVHSFIEVDRAAESCIQGNFECLHVVLTLINDFG